MRRSPRQPSMLATETPGSTLSCQARISVYFGPLYNVCDAVTEDVPIDTHSRGVTTRTNNNRGCPTGTRPGGRDRERPRPQ